MSLFTLLWLWFAASHVDAAKPALDPIELMKLPRTNNICPQLTTARMNDQARNLIVDIHNRRRAVLAQGQVRNGRNDYNTPKGSNIMTMEYNCDLERDAQMYADLCTSAGSPEAQRPLWGENFNVIQDTLDPILAVSRVSWVVLFFLSGLTESCKTTTKGDM
ncbi:SCP-like protein [Ancylostoma caninum]|uniref:SCP-like protein n=1 Tax=Ancylostoma caninum TaxID=29170 RepID=A0A368FY11_ANCCA|nr:SCP-like protein [Ancylostoma caninum]